MKKPTYQNHEWYIRAGWSDQPKERFKACLDIIQKQNVSPNCRILDVGCATGEFLGYLRRSIPGAWLVGVDYAEDLLTVARQMLPDVEFRFASALELPDEYNESFDVVTSIGCISIFDEQEVALYWKNLVGACKPGGTVVVLGPLNEHGVDVMTRHRKRMPGREPKWETGWNIHSIDTVREVVSDLGYEVTIMPFRIPFSIARDEDPVRTWTERFGSNDFQLTNGLKLLIDHYFVIVE